MGEIAGEEEVLVSLFPDLGLMGPDPVGLGLGLEVGNRLGHAHQHERQPPLPADRLETKGATLIRPHDGRSQWPSLLIDIDHGGALRGEGNTGHLFRGDRTLLPERLTP